MVTMVHVLSTVVAGTSIAAVATNPTYFKNILDVLVRATGYGSPGGGWRIAAILLALANFKILPFVWHVCLPSSSHPESSIVATSLTPNRSASSVH
jgi:hypothetical protein